MRSNASTVTEDHCWLLSIPLPDSRNKPWFHLMIDSWLLGPALQVPVLWTSLFTTEHLNEPAVKGYDDVVDLCRMIDQAGQYHSSWITRTSRG